MAASSNAVAASPRPPDGLAALFLANDFRGRHASAFVVVTEDGGDWDARFFDDALSGRAEHANARFAGSRADTRDRPKRW